MPADIDWQQLHGSFFEKKNVVVTGGAGFIGSHLVDALIRLGATVTVIDDLSTGHAENVPTAAQLVRQSVTSPAIASAFAGVELLERAYKTAIERAYRFYSYGDAMLIL